MKYSYIITEGFVKSKVYIDEVLNKKLGGYGGVTTVSSLPAVGEKGKVYYNTTDSKYYTYGDNGFSEFGADAVLTVVSGDSLPVSENMDPEHLSPSGTDAVVVEYDLRPGVYYDFGNVGPSTGDYPDEYNRAGIILNFPDYENGITAACSYVGRFTAGVANLPFTVKSPVHIDDETSEISIEEGHTYEFNVLHDTCRIIDITYTPNNG